MDPESAPPRRRLAAWLVTGPVGHGVAAALDIAFFLAAVGRERIRRGFEGE